MAHRYFIVTTCAPEYRGVIRQSGSKLEKPYTNFPSPGTHIPILWYEIPSAEVPTELEPAYATYQEAAKVFEDRL